MPGTQYLLGSKVNQSKNNSQFPLDFYRKKNITGEVGLANLHSFMMKEWNLGSMFLNWMKNHAGLLGYLKHGNVEEATKMEIGGGWQ